jgi:hypothetical protein
MIDRGRLFDTPTFRWLPARSGTEVEYFAVTAPDDRTSDISAAVNAGR